MLSVELGPAELADVLPGDEAALEILLVEER
jgi:hypothetical protein